ncbi:hypothetical protein ACFC0D_19350 [Streptomyces sp. NPDC056222]|uniref:hypothetical protein n=1 Tax=Streptomyces sp. NPDC056222 TaxID=3345749 RepID=UPI0035D5725F
MEGHRFRPQVRHSEPIEHDPEAPPHPRASRAPSTPTSSESEAHDTYRPGDSSAGDPATHAADLKAGDQIPVLGGAAVRTVLDAVHDTASGSILLHLVLASGPDTVQLPSATGVDASRPQPEAEQDVDEGKDVTDGRANGHRGGHLRM